MSEEVSSNVEVEDAIAFKAGLKKTLDINDSKLDSQGIGFKTEHAAAMLILIDMLRHAMAMYAMTVLSSQNFRSFSS